MLNEFKINNNDNTNTDDTDNTDNTDKNNNICQISCLYYFHKYCIVKWLNKNCPMCRTRCNKYDKEKKEFIKPNDINYDLSNLKGTRISNLDLNFDFDYINYERLLNVVKQ